MVRSGSEARIGNRLHATECRIPAQGPRSLSAGSRPLAHPGQGQPREQALEGVDPGGMAVAPLDPEAVRAHQGQGDRPDIPAGWRRDPVSAARSSPRRSRHRDRPDAGRGPGRTPSWPALVPFDAEAVVLAIDGVRDGVHGAPWAMGDGRWAIGCWQLAVATPNKKPSTVIGGFLEMPIAMANSHSLLRHQILQTLAGLTFPQAQQAPDPEAGESARG